MSYTGNLTRTLLEQSAFNDDDIAIVSGDQELSFGSLKCYISCFTTFVSRSDLVPGDRALLLLDDSPFFIVSFLGFINAGIVPVPVNPRTKLTRHFIEDSQCRCVIVEGEQYNLHCAEFDSNLDVYVHCSDPLRIESLAIAQQMKIKEDSALCLDRIGQYAPADTYVSAGPNDPAFWQYTSGTTGRPKGVVHCHAGMLASTELFAKNTLGLRRGDKVFSVAKMFFGYGLGNSLFFPLYNGCIVIIEPKWPSVDVLYEVMGKHRPTVVFAGPKIYYMLLESGISFSEVLSETRIFMSAGSYLPRSLNERWQEVYHLPIYDGVGCTEMGHVYLSNYGDPVVDGVSAGRIVPGYNVKLVVTDDTSSRVQGAGELWVKGPSKCLGYWNGIGLSQTSFSELLSADWHNTGDLFVETDGVYLYQGRTDDLFKINGRWVVPKNIEEDICHRFCDITEIALVDHEDDSEMTICSLFYVSQAEMFDEADLERFIESTFDRYMRPSSIFLLNALPKNCNGKIDKNALRALAVQAGATSRVVS